MTTKKTRKRSLWWLAVVVPLFLFLGTIAFGLMERWRGQRQLAAIKREMREQGQPTQLEQMFPDSSKADYEFNDRFETISSALPQSFLHGGGNQVEVAPGKAGRGSQAPYPVVNDLKAYLTNETATLDPSASRTWKMLQHMYATNQAVFSDLRQLMANPPSVTGANYKLGYNFNFVKPRMVAQVLNDRIIIDLHRRDLEEAEENLIALTNLQQLYSDEPTLVSQMIRVAIGGIANAALWDALADDRWTEAQLHRLQQAWTQAPLMSNVVATIHFERLARLDTYETFRSQSYAKWRGRNMGSYAALGITLPEMPFFVEPGREYLFHPVWSTIWADQEMAAYLRRSAFLTTLPQEALQKRAFANFSEQWTKQETLPDRSSGDLRFYLLLPFQDELVDIIVQVPQKKNITFPQVLASWVTNDFKLSDFSKTLSVAAEYENKRAMSVTSIALKRYSLRHGHYPEALGKLLPEFLPELPVDWMDGEPLRYRRNQDSSYTLYSVGSDGLDNGGDPTADFLWPTSVPWTD